MAYDETYAQDTYANASADFVYDSDNPSFPDVSSGTGLSNEPTANANAPNWQWTTGTSPSSSTGPPAANGGCTFPESSSDAAAGDICLATMITGNQVNASLYLLYVDIDICTYGNAAATLWVEAWDGTQWNIIHTRVGDATTTFTSITDLDCTAYTNSDFYVRVRVELATTGNVYWSDFAFQNLRIHGADAVTSEIDQDGFRFYDDGTESGSSARQDEDTDDTIAKEITFQLRVQLDATDDPDSEQFQLEYKETSDGAGEYRKVSLT